MKWVTLERRSDPFRNLLPVSEIFISVTFDKSSRKKKRRKITKALAEVRISELEVC